MVRLPCLFACLALALAAPGALAETQVDARLPVLAAQMENGKVHAHIARTISAQTRAGMTHALTIEGFDASGASLGVIEKTVPRRNAWATVTLPAPLAGAARLTVSID